MTATGCCVPMPPIQWQMMIYGQPLLFVRRERPKKP